MVGFAVAGGERRILRLRQNIRNETVERLLIVEHAEYRIHPRFAVSLQRSREGCTVTDEVGRRAALRRLVARTRQRGCGDDPGQQREAWRLRTLFRVAQHPDLFSQTGDFSAAAKHEITGVGVAHRQLQRRTRIPGYQRRERAER